MPLENISMKLLNRWTRNLSVGAALATFASSVNAQDVGGITGGMKPASYAKVAKQSKAAPASYVNSAENYSLVSDPTISGPMGPGGMIANQPIVPVGYNCDATGSGPCGPDCGCEMGAGGGPLGMGGLGGNACGCGPGMACGLCAGRGQGGMLGGCGPECGPGCGCGLALGNGCGPLGCNGGTFGDGRYVRDLFGGCQGRLRKLPYALLPYGEGGVAAQRWFDFSADVIAFKRTKGAGSRNFSSQGRATDNFVLNSDNVDLDQLRAGLALQANVQVGPGSSVEVGYFGLNKWRESATVVSATPTLYSFISDYGRSPFDGFDDPDRSFVHALNYESTLNNGEVNLRRRWVEPSGFVQGSLLAGVRYFELEEALAFTATGQNNNALANNGLRFFDYNTKTENQMTGFQIGGDLWLNVVPGIKVGTELKGGIYGNHATQNTRIRANSLGAFGIPEINEKSSDGRTAYLGQLSVTGIYRLTYSWAIRSSYQMLFVDNVALAPENINPTPPALFLPGAARATRINVDGELVYTGFSVGAEYLW